MGSETLPSACYILSDESSIPFYSTSNGYNKGERYSRVPRLSDTRYSAKWRYASSKARLKCATYRRYTDLSVMGVRVGVANFLDQSIGIDETNTFQLKIFI